MNGEQLGDIGFNLGVDRRTVGEWASRIRELISNDREKNKIKIGGLAADGTQKIVEIDESLFFKRKYYKGRVKNGDWYVGGVERNSKKAFISLVANRNADTMVEVIAENVLPGTIIITDNWKAYKKAFEKLQSY